MPEDYLQDLIKKARKLKEEQKREKASPSPKEKKMPSAPPEKDIPGELKRELFEPKISPERQPPKASGTGKVKEEDLAVETRLPIKPRRVEEQMALEKKVEVEAYRGAKIFRVPKQEIMYYEAPVLKPTAAERTIINTIKEAATRIISIAPYRIRDPEQRRNVYKQRVLEILRSSTELNIPERRYEFYAESVVREMVGYGMIDPLVRDDQLEEIMVIGANRPVYVFHRKYEMMHTNIEFANENEIVDLVNRIAREVGRRVDMSSPLLDARLPNGSRVNATIPPASISGASLTIRKFREDPYSIVDLISFGTVDSYTAAFLWLCVDGLGAKPANILITGGTGSGKTTTLNVLCSFIPDRERIVTIEDTAELNLPLRHYVSLEARPPGLEGSGELTLDILTKNSLRMRPDRIIVGEVRHSEAFTLFTALNTGHDGALAGDSLIQLSNGNMKEIGEIAGEGFSEKIPVKEKGFEFVELGEKAFEVPSMNKETLQIENKKVTHVWRKKTRKKIVKLKLKSGKELRLTGDHPVYRIFNGVQEISACDANKGDFLAVPDKTSGKENSAENGLDGLVLLECLGSVLAFEEIVSAEEEEFEGMVYDLTVEGNHNYIANGIIVSNCLGTIHANSPQETVVRITSPPMNVPEIMLSGLDFILVEHRIHDKRKGTIRRFMELAEVTGVLEGKTQTQTLFEWDAVKDKIEKTRAESHYLKNLMKFTGYTRKQLEETIKERQAILEGLVKKKVRSIKDVGNAVQKYYAEKGAKK